MPNMQVLGTSGTSVIDPYGTFGGTGTGGVGTYGLTANQATFTFTGSISGTTLTLTSTPAPLLAPGQSLTSSTGGGFSATHIVALLTGAGASGSTYSVDVSQTAAAGTISAAGALYSSGTPGTLFAAPLFYQTLAPSATLPGAVTPRTQAVVGDFINNIGGATSATAPNNHSGWGGSLANVAMLWGQFPQSTGGAPSTSALASLCKKTTDIQAFASANGLTVHSLYRLNDLGIWADSSAAQFTGTITGASGGTATLNISSTQSGATTALPNTTTIAGVGVAGCPQACPKTTAGSGSTYTLSFGAGTAANLASSPMTAGAFAPVPPIVRRTVSTGLFPAIF